MNLVNKLVLGTVQFGLDYGINNCTGKVTESEVSKILSLAKKEGINNIDTSYAYGDSEVVLGKVITDTHYDFRVVSKYPPSKYSVIELFKKTLERLQSNNIYGYLIHDFEFYQSHPEIWTEMKFLRNNGMVEKIGFSLYTVNELEFLLNHGIDFDVLQFPYNLLDRQFESYFPLLKKMNVEIYTRSVFLQGLFFKELENIPSSISPLKSYLHEIHQYCSSKGMSVEQCALSFVLRNFHIDGVLIGVDNALQLEKNIEVAKNTVDVAEFVSPIKKEEYYLLNPSNWG